MGPKSRGGPDERMQRTAAVGGNSVVRAHRTQPSAGRFHGLAERLTATGRVAAVRYPVAEDDLTVLISAEHGGPGSIRRPRRPWRGRPDRHHIRAQPQAGREDLRQAEPQSIPAQPVRLVVCPDRHDRAHPAAPSAIRACPAGAGRCPGTGHNHHRAARPPQGRSHPVGRARADRGGERLRPRSPAEK